MEREVFLLSGARTPFCVWARGRRGDGARGGALRERDPFDLGAAAIRGALVRGTLAPERVDRVVFGNMYQDGPHACYGARYIGLRAGLPDRVPCLTLSMACGTGLHSLIEAAQDVKSGEADCVAAGGTDVVSRIPKEIFVPSFHDLACGSPIGRTVEPLAAARGIDRAEMDRFALQSHRRARSARAAGRLGEEIVAVDAIAEDDAILPEAEEGRVARAKPAQGEAGGVTSANTHAIVDGASALIVCSGKALSGAQIPLGRLRAWAYAGVAPAEMGLASVPAVREALGRAGWKTAEVDLFEINETFAAQLLIDIRELGLQEAKVNVNGGAIAFGHPFAASGGRLVLGLLLELKRRGLKRGVASICVGGGMGVAVAVER